MAKTSEKVVTRFKQPKGLPLLRKWRKHRNLTQDRLADRMGELLDGFSTSSISQLETMKQGYSQETLEALAVCLDCQPGELLMRDPTLPDANIMLAAMKPETRRRALAMLKALEEDEKAEKAA